MLGFDSLFSKHNIEMKIIWQPFINRGKMITDTRVQKDACPNRFKFWVNHIL